MSAPSSTRDRVGKIVLFILGALATAVFVVSKDSALMAWATKESYRDGDLYRVAQVARFRPRQPLPYGPGLNLDSLDQGRALQPEDSWIFVGDSFGFNDWGAGTFPTQLGRELSTSFFSVYNNNHRQFWHNPFALFPTSFSPRSQRRVLVYEIVERLIDQQFTWAVPPEPPLPDSHGRFFLLLREIYHALLKDTETRHALVIKHSFATAPLVTLWNTFAFECFRRIPGETPYSLDPPTLFFRDEMISFQTVHRDEQIAKLADHIAKLARDLSERHHCDFVFVPVPNKVTVYAQMVTDQPYDDFLPRLCSALKERQVTTVELLPVFQKQSGWLYWPSDSHWNERGLELAIGETLRELRTQDAAVTVRK